MEPRVAAPALAIVGRPIASRPRHDRTLPRHLPGVLLAIVLLADVATILLDIAVFPATNSPPTSFQELLAPVTGKGGVAVAASTLVVAGLFHPLRNKVQRRVDHRFNRARYDAERTVTAFGLRLREAVDLATVVFDLDATVYAAIAPDRIEVWLRTGGR